ncbi:MAG: beta-eliminating lyase-related protein [Gammaproteobacteria bacterium]
MSCTEHRQSSREQRVINLAQHDHDTSRLDSAQVDFDFSTDSWGQLSLPYMKARMDILRQRASQHPLDITQVLARHFPFHHFIVTPRGRDAEDLLFTALAKPHTKVVQNILFHTARSHQLSKGMLPVEIPHAQAFTDSTFPFKGNVDVDKLAQILATQKVSVVFIEALSNGVGGHPVSMENLRAVRALAQRHGVPVYLDATRAVENCMLIREHETEFAGRDVRTIMQEFFSCCDGVTASLVKDYGVTCGGLLATNSAEVYAKACEHAGHSTLMCGDVDQTLLAQAIDDRDYVANQVQVRMQQTKMLSESLLQAGFPVRLPVGAHAVILDLSGLGITVPGYLAWLYELIGLRGARHWGGATLEYQRPLWIRLAMPLGFSALKELQAALVAISPNIPASHKA